MAGGIDGLGERIHGEGAAQDGVVLAVFGHGTLCHVRDDVLCAHLQPFVHVVFAVDVAGKALVEVVVAGHDTVVARVVERHVEVALVVAVLEVDAVLLHQGVLKQGVAPVGVRAVPEGGVVEAQSLVIVDVLLGVHHLRLAAHALDGPLSAVRDLALSGLAALGGDHDHAVAGLCTVDGGRSCILQHLHALYVIGVDV